MKAWTIDADDIRVAEDLDESLLYRTPEIDGENEQAVGVRMRRRRRDRRDAQLYIAKIIDRDGGHASMLSKTKGARPASHTRRSRPP